MSFGKHIWIFLEFAFLSHLLIPLPLPPFWPRVSIGREIYFPPLPLFSQVKLSTSKKRRKGLGTAAAVSFFSLAPCNATTVKGAF